MKDAHVESLASDVFERLGAARKALLAEMHNLGLTPEKGWRIIEELRHTAEGTQWIFRPMHLHEHLPELSRTVLVDHDGRPV